MAENKKKKYVIMFIYEKEVFDRGEFAGCLIKDLPEELKDHVTFEYDPELIEIIYSCSTVENGHLIKKLY